MALSYSKKYSIIFTRSDNKMIVRKGGAQNTFYVYGGKDESSYMLIQGITLAGVLLDEVALMTQSFVEEALARCLTFPNRRYWFNCNPDSPEHWFYKEWILHPAKHKALHLHFLMDDNPALTRETIEQAAQDFSGVFYDRKVLGLWVVAEGLIYPMFDRLKHLFNDAAAPQSGEWFISIDYGIQNPFSAGLWCVSGNVAYRMAEYYHDGRIKGQRTDEEHAVAVITLAGKRYIRRYVVDPSAASFIVCLKKRAFGQAVMQANNDVIPGISNVASALKQGRIKIHENCKDFIREMGLYSWDEKAKEDKPIKENDHAADDTRYFVRTILRKMLPSIETERG
jgi:PBSX family phage terminase large subunit